MTSVLVVDDEVRFRELYLQTLSSASVSACAAASAEEALRILETEPVDMVVSDVRMPGGDGISLLRRARERRPGLPFLLVTAYADVRQAVDALRLGAVDYLAKPVDLDELLAAVRDTLGLPRGDSERVLPPEALAGFVAESPALLSVLRDAFLVAASDVPVLVSGESGSGKEVVARFVHENSKRRAGPLVAVNCASLPEALVASELFGHERGAFTGATERRTGRFRQAQGGTLFLDEIGDMPLALQPALLRALETGRITPVGSDREQAVDYRLVAATNRDLEGLVAEGRFRLDLFHRLNVIHLVVPALRERLEDVLPLARRFLATPGGAPKRISRAASEALHGYGWPGNVRELANAMQRARLLSRADVILPEHLPPAVRDAAPARPIDPERSDDGDDPDRRPAPTLRESEKEALRHALAETGGNRTHAAALLGISRRGLINKLKRYGL